MNTIEIHLCAEDRKRLDRLGDALEALAKHDCHSCTSTVAQVMATNAQDVAAAVAAAAGVETPTVIEPAPEKATKAGQPAPVVENHPAPDDLPFDTAPAAPTPKPVTLDDVRAMAQMLLAPASGKREACKAIITKYASKISLIPADKLPAVAAELEALQKGVA